MEIITLPLGGLKANCYILKNNNCALIIDPADEFPTIKKHIGSANVEAILLTHNHFDHVGALKETEEFYHLKANDTSNIKSFTTEIIKTPGHSSDSQTFYFKDQSIMFTGDFLFYHTIGRTDLRTGNINQMQESLKLISTYPSETKIYPGHGEPTTLGEEKPRFPYYFI